MIRPIVHTHFMLNRIAQDATPHSNEDIRIAQDLADTLGAHAHECVGMAANMIGKNKRIIIFDDKGSQRIMYNPSITAAHGAYNTEESCLSLEGVHPCKRFNSITVSFLDESFVQKTESFSGFTAQIIQHEIDHTNGILI